MAVPLRLPDVGTVEGEVTVVRWLKSQGESVVAGEPLLEVETDKGIITVEAAAGGVLLKTLVAEGQTAQSDDLIAYVGAAGEAVPQKVGPTPAAARPPAAAAASAPGVTPAKVSPVVRKLAQEKGVDLSSVQGTGPGGTITREDVLRSTGGAAGPAASKGRPLPHHQAIVARKVSQSHREKPTIHLTASVDMGRAIAARTQSGYRYDAMFVKAVGAAIREHPVFRCYLKGDDIVEHSGIDVALAVAVGDDLYAPAVRRADAEPLHEISRLVEALVGKARARSLTPQEMEDSCFLVSNLGSLPIESFDAVIYPDHSAALAVGAIVPTPAADKGGNVRVVPQLRMTLSVDHRLINGKAAAQLLTRVKGIVEGGDFA